MPQSPYSRLDPPVRTLLGPGPSSVPPEVMAALTAPVLGHLDPEFLKIMDQLMEGLRAVFQTKNRMTLAISGTGSAGMEASICNPLEPGDVAVIGVNGYFGGRMVEMAQRCGATVVTAEAEWGRTIPPEAIEDAIKKQRKVKLVALVHAETSAGILQPIAEAAKLAHRYGALFMTDAVTSLGGAEVAIDGWGVDICYSGTQKCIGAPPGLAPITFGEAAMDVMRKRTHKVHSWYLDVGLIEQYWGAGRVYHHTAPISMIYALHEAVRLTLEEGLPARWARHRLHAGALQAGLEAMGLTLHAEASHRAPMLTTVRIPDGVDDAAVRRALLTDDSIEIGGGLGPLKGKVWRVGLMGHSCNEGNVLLFLEALERALAKQGRPSVKGQSGAGAEAASAYYRRERKKATTP